MHCGEGPGSRSSGSASRWTRGRRSTACRTCFSTADCWRASRAKLDLDVADAFLAWWEQQPAELRTGNAGIWFGPWTREQMAYAVMLAAAERAGEAFDAGYHIGFDPGAVFNHFLGCNVARRDVLACLSGLAERLGEGSDAAGAGEGGA